MEVSPSWNRVFFWKTMRKVITLESGAYGERGDVLTEQPEASIPNEKSQKKPLRILIGKTELEIPSLGIVLVDRLTLGAMRKVTRLLEQDTNSSDSEIVRAIFGAVIYLPASEKNEDERLVNSTELAQITDTDLNFFASAFNERQGWVAEAGDISPIKLLVEKLRDELRKLNESIRETLNLSNTIFSENTRKLMAESALIGERLKELAGASKFSEQYGLAASSAKNILESMNSSSLHGVARKIVEEQDKFAVSISGLTLDQKIAKDEIPAFSRASYAPPTLYSDALSENIRKAAENSPIARSARTLSSLDAKVDEVLEIARTVAELHGKTNEAILSGLSNIAELHGETNKNILSGLLGFKQKWQQDDNASSNSLKWAVRGILFSVFFSFVAVTQDYFTNQGNDRQQLVTKALLVEQVRLANEAAINQVQGVQTFENRVKELESKLAAQALREARATKKPPSEQK